MDLGWLFNHGTLTFIAGGLLVTLQVAAISIALSFVAGVALALGRLSRLGPLSAAATAYIEGMRALPVLLVIFFSYFALPRIIGVKLDPFAAGVIGLSAFTAALVAEIVRAGILAVPKGLIEAAQSQGFSGSRSLWDQQSGSASALRLSPQAILHRLSARIYSPTSSPGSWSPSPFS